MANHDELKKELAVGIATAMFQNLALIGALAERHLVDPVKVADWVEFFAKGMENSVGNGPANPEHLRKVAAQLHDYARQLVNIVKPENPEE